MLGFDFLDRKSISAKYYETAFSGLRAALKGKREGKIDFVPQRICSFARILLAMRVELRSLTRPLAIEDFKKLKKKQPYSGRNIR